MRFNFFKNISPVLIVTYLLLAIGLIFISISSLSDAQNSFGDKFFYLKKQSLWFAAGTISLFVFSKINLTYIKKLIYPAFFASIFFLILVLIPGISTETLGARRWLIFGPINFQPSEVFKIISIFFFARLFSQESKRTIKNLVIYLGIPILLIILEPNMSTTVLITAIIASIYYLSGSDIKQLFVLTLIGFLVSIILIIGSPYRQARLQTLIDPSSDISGKSYHSNQIIISIASGGLFGKGIGNSSQKYQFLPELTTDSILAIIGEETGFLGISFIIFLYVLLIISIFKISKASPDPENQLISAGVGCWIAFQSLINISAIASIIPLTGIPLPFISYGGSSLLMLLSSIGIILNINNQNQLSSKIQKK